MRTTQGRHSPADVGPRSSAAGLLATSHPGPAVAVTVIAALLAIGADRPAPTVAIVAAAVFAGQLTVGWVNDLADVGRDTAVGRADKPLATGAVAPGTVRGALVVAAVACVGLSLAAGWRSGVVHLLLGVGSAQAYNLLLKATVWSWVPYAVAFGSLPAVAGLAGPDPTTPGWWLFVAGASLGVGAHVLNALPDLADDVSTGVRGLPHRLGERRARPLAASLLLLASVVAVLGPPGAPAPTQLIALVVVLALALLAMTGRGQVPFLAAVAIALLDVALLVVAR